MSASKTLCRHARPLGEDRGPEAGEIVKSRIVVGWGAGWVRGVAGGNEADHALPRAGEEDAVGVAKVLPPVGFVDGLPG